ncbi:acetate--CoA ligase [soil metagenome]
MTTKSPITFTDSMRALLHPKSVAIIGDSPNPGFAPIIRRNIVTCGFEGEVYPINPRYDEIAGLKAYPSVDAVPGKVDLAVIGVPVRAVDAVLENCERAGVKAINIITSGYGEQSDELAHQRQELLSEYARRTGIRIVGPNCLGNISVPGKLCAMSGSFEFLKPGPVGLVLQSGLLAYSLVTPPMDRDMGFSYVVTTGNEADLEAADLMRYYVEDDETRVIGAFIEQFRDPEKLIEVAEMAAEREKPIVVLKIGRSEAGKRSAQAHTGSMVGSDEVADAVMRQYGIIRVNGLDEMTETLAAFYTDRLPAGTGVGAIYVSGGAAGLVSDLSADLGIDLPDLSPKTVERLEAVIPEYGTVGNPLDTTGQAGAIPELMRGAIESMAEDPNIHTVVYGQAYPMTVDLDTPAGEVMRVAHEKYPDKVFLAVSLVPGEIAVQNRRDTGEPPHEPVTNWGGVPFLQGVENGLRAVKHLNTYASYVRNRSPNGRVASDSPVAAMARELVQASGGKPLVERAAKHLLTMYGIPTTPEQLATTLDNAVTAANEIGYPVVLKIESADITHKTDAGGVLLDLADDDAVRTGFDRIMANARAYNPDAELAGVLVQQMAPSGGREMIVGMTRDPDFGPAVAVGLGGIFVEVLKDVALGVPPLSELAARNMLDRLRGKAILDGTRGQGPADVDAVVDILLKFSQLCLDLKDEVAEIDINPLLVYEDGALVVDCLVVAG